MPIGWTIDAPATGLLAPGTSGEVDLRLTPGPGSAYEQASLLLTVRSEADLGTREWTTLTVRVFCPSDFNRDQGVDFFDYLDFSEAFATDEPSADFNADASVDFFDYLDFVARFGAGC
ncbi:MAG: GC-type dockerin domain-anchored protein [Planctomycetota bacterium]|nr:GC-type dockerin domain-anchored protein [Planctomycetota bacterium]